MRVTAGDILAKKGAAPEYTGHAPDGLQILSSVAWIVWISSVPAINYESIPKRFQPCSTYGKDWPHQGTLSLAW